MNFTRFYSSPNNIPVVKSRRMRGGVALGGGGDGNGCTVFVRKSRGKNHLEKTWVSMGE
jgi:hypothetical protein